MSFSREASFASSPDILLPLEGNGVATADTHGASYLGRCMGGNFDFSSFRFQINKRNFRIVLLSNMHTELKLLNFATTEPSGALNSERRVAQRTRKAD